MRIGEYMPTTGGLSHAYFPQLISIREDDTATPFSLVLDGPLLPILNLRVPKLFVRRGGQKGFDVARVG